jgi:N-acetylglucosaminyldiphosphoundecaprenol N-acetyl-beta-D-mannosaminyltransferase
MNENRLGNILLQHGLITQSQLQEALNKQQELAQEHCWQPLGEILVQSEIINNKELAAVLTRQAKLKEIENFDIIDHPSVGSKLKRAIDVLGALVGLTLAAFLLPIFAIAIYLDSPGPILFSQYRVGLRGKQFRIWKFRTMARHADRYRFKVAGTQTYKFFNQRNHDPRVTRVGKILRKTHLDEIPQFFNVLKGEMSLVGTRPPTLDEVKAYSKEDWQRLAIKPGMTGLWQIDSEKYQATFEQVLAFDKTYIRSWSHSLDYDIITSTLSQILLGTKNKGVKGLQAASYKKVHILNTWVDNLSMSELLGQLESGVVFTPNVDHIIKLQRDEEFSKIYDFAHYRVCDSQILMYASKFLGFPLKEKVSGSDLFPAFCKFHRDHENIKVFLLGGDQGVAERAKNRLNTIVGREIVVEALSPSFGFEKNEQECLEIVEKINQTGATVLAIGVGAPKQEKWIYKYRDRLPHVKIFLAIGASIDFEAKTVKRSPKWMSQVGLEWLYRLIREPRRLWKRYLVDDIPFLWLILLQKFGLYTPPSFSDTDSTVLPTQVSSPITKTS